MSAIKLSTPSSGSISLSPADTASNLTITVPATTGTALIAPTALTVPNTTGTVMVSGNMPAFSAYQSSSTSLSSGTFTKVLFGTEEFDTNNNFASSTFTPTVAGYYQVNGAVNIDTITGQFIAAIYKNGSRYKDGVWLSVVAQQTKSLVSSVVYCNGTTDYLEIYAFNSGSTANTVNIAVQGSYFNAVLVRAV
jgi:hypothetical protein